MKFEDIKLPNVWTSFETRLDGSVIYTIEGLDFNTPKEFITGIIVAISDRKILHNARHQTIDSLMVRLPATWQSQHSRWFTVRRFLNTFIRKSKHRLRYEHRINKILFLTGTELASE